MNDLLAELHARINRDGEYVVGLRLTEDTPPQIRLDWADGITEAQQQTIQDALPGWVDEVRAEASARDVSRQRVVRLLRQRLAAVESNADLVPLYDDVRALADNNPRFGATVEARLRIVRLAHDDLLTISFQTSRGKAMYLEAAISAAVLWSL